MSQLGFQAGIKVANAEPFDELRTAIHRAFAPETLERFYNKLKKSGVRVRDFGSVLERGLLEQVDEQLGDSGRTAKQLYESLSVAEQGLVRELYLTAVEAVNPQIREKYSKLYRYY